MNPKRVAALGLVTLLLAAAALPSMASADSRKGVMRWDIISLDFATLTLTPGGHASAFATGGGGTAHTGKITLTGHGNFRIGHSRDVTGGGTWQTFDGAGTMTGSGKYRVTRLVDFDLAPGFIPPAFTDHVGKQANAHSGLAVLKIRYDDRSDGILIVSCDLPAGSPDTLFEGITATKGYIDYWERDPAVAGVDANRTNFHALGRINDD